MRLAVSIVSLSSAHLCYHEPYLLNGVLDEWEQSSLGEQHARVEGSLLNNKVFNGRLCSIVCGDALLCQEAIVTPHYKVEIL
jgi:hypothetical protein